MTNTTTVSSPLATDSSSTMYPNMTLPTTLLSSAPPSSGAHNFAQKVEKVQTTVEHKIQEFNNSVGGPNETTKAKELKNCLVIARDHLQNLKKKNQTHIEELNDAAKELREIISLIDEMNQTETYYQVAIRTQEKVSSVMHDAIDGLFKQWDSFSQYANSTYHSWSSLLPSWNKNT